MPHPNVETLRRIDKAQVAGDLETALSQYTDDVLGHVGGDNKLSGDYRGLEQLQAMLGRFMEASGEYSFENHAYLADDQHGIILERGTMRRGGETFSTNEGVRDALCAGRVGERTIGGGCGVLGLVSDRAWGDTDDPLEGMAEGCL
jgi:hypothetical protein